MPLGKLNAVFAAACADIYNLVAELYYTFAQHEIRELNGLTVNVVLGMCLTGGKIRIVRVLTIRNFFALIYTCRVYSGCPIIFNIVYCKHSLSS